MRVCGAEYYTNEKVNIRITKRGERDTFLRNLQCVPRTVMIDVSKKIIIMTQKSVVYFVI